MGKPWRTIVSKRVADLLWPGQDPIGRTIVLWKGQGDNRAEVIGVVATCASAASRAIPPWRSTSRPAAARQLAAARDAHPGQTRGRRPGSAIRDRWRRSPSAGVQRAIVRRCRHRIGGHAGFTMLLLAGFAGLALVLALAGVYGVLAYSVARRTNEIGIRLALGAAHGSVLGLVVAQGLRPVFVRAGGRPRASVWLSRLMTSLLFGVTASDPLTYGRRVPAVNADGDAGVLSACSDGASVNPVVALRND